MTVEAIPRIRIETPSAAAAFLLEDRMRSFRPNALLDGRRWWVELTCDDAEFDEVVAAVRDWLDESGNRATTVWLEAARPTEVRGQECAS